MSTSRERILNRLRESQPTLGAIETGHSYLPVVPMVDLPPQEQINRFVEQARLLSSNVYLPSLGIEAIRVILDVLGEDRRVMSWAFDRIPLSGLEEALAANGVQVVPERDATVRVGITGADAALASTGSLVMLTGKGKSRLASLLPAVHVAIIHQSQIIANLETWVAMLRNEGLGVFQGSASAIMISGPSRTADIAMQLILGMHGPGELHIIILSRTD